MNVMPQVCGIIVLITIIIFHLLQKKLSLRTEISFFLMLLIMLLVHVLDIFSLIAIKNSETISPIVACHAKRENLTHKTQKTRGRKQPLAFFYNLLKPLCKAIYRRSLNCS